jgi:vitamin-K-epoxide reductase (warfarin-sensitive)
MRWILIVLALMGITVSSLALREHYRTDVAPCDINEKWDCGIVNHSMYAVFWGVPVAVIGIAGYFLMAGLAFKRAYRILLAAALVGLGFSLYLANVEAHILGVWCVYCVASLGMVALIAVLTLGVVVARTLRKPAASSF